MLKTHDRIIEDLAAVQGRLRTADSAMRLRQHKDEGTPAPSYAARRLWSRDKHASTCTARSIVKSTKGVIV
jgi:hypothetical protein